MNTTPSQKTHRLRRHLLLGCNLSLKKLRLEPGKLIVQVLAAHGARLCAGRWLQAGGVKSGGGS